jgi:hypothetical protein
MDHGFRWPDESRLITVLKELDASQALVRKSREELRRASSDLARSGLAPECLSAFVTRNRSLSEAAERYRVAIQAFNVVCRKKALVAVA